jgi:hypothetical protein
MSFRLTHSRCLLAVLALNLPFLSFSFSQEVNGMKKQKKALLLSVYSYFFFLVRVSSFTVHKKTSFLKENG